MPKVSVCMVTYNHGEKIREAIDGVLMQQTSFDIELVIGNDCSTDHTDAIVSEILQNHPKAGLIRYSNRERNEGMMANFAAVLQQCSGQYVAMCDGDDYWTDPLKLQKQVDFLDVNPEYALCFHRAKVLKPDGQLLPDYITSVPDAHETLEDLVTRGNYIHTATVVYRNIVREFPAEFFRTPIGDYFMHILVARHGKIKFLDAEMAVYRQGVGVLSQQQDISGAFNMVKFYSCLLSYFDDRRLLEIVYGRQLNLLNIYNSSARHKFSSTAYLAKNKTFVGIFKVIVKKIIG